MEDFLGWTLLAIGIVAPVLMVVGGVKLYRSHQRKAEQEEIARHERYAEYLRTREKERSAISNKTPKKVPAESSYIKSKYADSTSTATSSSGSNDSLLSDLATLYVLNSALNHGSASAKVDYDAGTIKTDNSSSGSWGLDDSSSRRSASDSFSSSDSSSSWSDSSSSSDSGPSSDW